MQFKKGMNKSLFKMIHSEFKAEQKDIVFVSTHISNA